MDADAIDELENELAAAEADRDDLAKRLESALSALEQAETELILVKCIIQMNAERVGVSLPDVLSTAVEMVRRIEKAEAEAARLRAALEKIVNRLELSDGDNHAWAAQACLAVERIANEALKGGA